MAKPCGELRPAGSNMSKAIDVDFQIAAPDEATAKRVADEARKLGYRVSIYGGISSPPKCQCTKSMTLTYQSLLAAQAELDAIARPLGAFADGWGTYGSHGKKYTRSGLQTEPVHRRWFQFSLRSLLVAVPVLGISCGLLCVAFSTGFPAANRFFAGLGGLLLCGGVIGAAVGYAEDPEHGSMIRQRAIFGAVLFPAILLLCAAGFALILCLLWRNVGVAG